jgi:carbonic anhydrase/acetyltransferase-like protein (isoleucine patch superfamily)
VIQDLAHLSREIKIGDNVFVGPNATIQGSELADNSFVAMGATVKHAKV